MQLFNISHNPPCGICANGTVVMLRGSKSEPVLCNPQIHLVAQYWQTNCRGVIYRHKPRPIFLCLKRFCTNLLLLLSFVHVSVSIFRYALSHTHRPRAALIANIPPLRAKRLLLCIPQTLDQPLPRLAIAVTNSTPIMSLPTLYFRKSDINLWMFGML